MRLASRPWIVAGCLAAGLVAAAPAAASAPVRLEPWHSTQEGSVAIGDDGRAVVLLVHGQHAWLASVTPDGALAAPPQPVPALPAVDGPSDVQVAMDPRGGVLGAYLGFTGEQPAASGDGLGGYGFQVLPYVLRTAWGAAPRPATAVQTGPIRADALRLALAPDGTGALAYAEDDIATDRHTSRAALLPPVGPTVLRAVGGLGPKATPSSLGVDGAERFVAAWEDDGRVALSPLGAGSVGAAARARTTGRALAPAPVRVSGAGVLVTAWPTPRTSTSRRAPTSVVRLAARAPGAARFGAPRVVARGRVELVDVRTAPSGATALLLARGHRLSLVVRDAAGRIGAPVALPGTAEVPDAASVPVARPTVALAADGRALVTYTARLSRTTTAARVVRVARGGAGVRIVADPSNCGALTLAGAPSGAGIVAIDCARPEARLEGEQHGGSVLTIGAGA